MDLVNSISAGLKFALSVPNFDAGMDFVFQFDQGC